MSNNDGNTRYELIKVPFHGEDVAAIMIDGQIYLVLTWACERLGVNIQDQVKRIKAHPVLAKGLRKIHARDITGWETTYGAKPEVWCLNRRLVQAWVFTINANRVRPEIRDHLLAYQEELAEALHVYETRGAVGNPRFALSEQVEAIKQQHEELAKQRAELEIGRRHLATLRTEHRQRCHQSEKHIILSHWLYGSDPDDMTRTNLTARGDWYLQSPPKPKNIEQKIWDKAPEKYRRAMFLIFSCDVPQEVVYDLLDRKHCVDPVSFRVWVDNNLGFEWL